MHPVDDSIDIISYLLGQVCFSTSIVRLWIQGKFDNQSDAFASESKVLYLIEISNYKCSNVVTPDEYLRET